MERVTLEPLGDLDALERRWRALEAVSNCGFFRSWIFLGCQIAERYASGRLLSVTQDGVDVALGLFGTAQGRLWLNQTGSPVLDGLFIEHNGLLVGTGHEKSSITGLRHAARLGHPVVLAGLNDAGILLAREAGLLVVQQSRFAPCVAIHALTKNFLETLSANARAQIRRSLKSYGPNTNLRRAHSLQQALEWFELLVDLHQRSWVRREQSGAFEAPVIRQFHRNLIARGWETGAVDVLRVEAEGQIIGVLYNFLHDGDVLSYQTGFAYNLEKPREKPGLVCHALAIEHYRAEGRSTYDLLAGEDRYKQTLANSGSMLHWATLYRNWSANGVSAVVRQFVSKRPRP